MSTYDVLGSTVTTPVEIREARSWFSTFAVPFRAARDLIAYSGLEPAPLPGGRALASLGFVRYVDGDLGPYHEFVVALIVRRPGGTDRRDTGAFIHQLPVNQPFTCAAGRGIWGFPKFVTDIGIDEGVRRDTATLIVDGALAVRLSIAHGVPTRVPNTNLDAYSWSDGVLRCTPWRLDGEGSRSRPGGVRVELGTGLIADELRVLGFPRRAIMSGTMRRVRMTFGDAHVVDLGAPGPASVPA
ncbi:MAG: acetoacetate decarboxylase family protein [Actinomycetes bacterium]